MAGSLATQGGLNLAAEGAVEGYAADVAGDKRLCVGGEPVDMVGQQTGVVCLPLVAVGLCVGMGEACLEVGGLVQEDPEEEGLGEVAVDGDLVALMPRIGMAVVAELGAPLAGDVKVYAVEVEIAVDPLDRRPGQVAAEDGAVFVGSVFH